MDCFCKFLRILLDFPYLIEFFRILSYECFRILLDFSGFRIIWIFFSFLQQTTVKYQRTIKKCGIGLFWIISDFLHFLDFKFSESSLLQKTFVKKKQRFKKYNRIFSDFYEFFQIFLYFHRFYLFHRFPQVFLLFEIVSKKTVAETRKLILN